MTLRLPPFLRSPVFWLLLGVFAAEFRFFDQIGARRHTTVHPRLQYQIQYLTKSYPGYEFARSRELVGGVLDALTNPSAQGPCTMSSRSSRFTSPARRAARPRGEHVRAYRLAGRRDPPWFFPPHGIPRAQ